MLCSLMLCGEQLAMTLACSRPPLHPHSATVSPPPPPPPPPPMQQQATGLSHSPVRAAHLGIGMLQTAPACSCALCGQLHLRRSGLAGIGHG